MTEWFRVANLLKLPVLSFTAQDTTTFRQLTMYARSHGSVSTNTNIDTAGPQVSAAEANQTTTDYWRGIDVFGGAANDGGGYGDPSIMNNSSPGSWWYETPGSYQYLSGRGYTVARIGFKWERLQPTLNAPLDPGELSRIQSAVSNAADAGMKAVLDLHNYCRYSTSSGVLVLGTGSLPISCLVDVWTRISTVFKNNSNVLAYSLMNEPHNMPTTPLGEMGSKHWEAASQTTLNAIRLNGDNHEVHVSVYEWGHAPFTPSNHLKGWIDDPANNFRYEAHHYLYYQRTNPVNYPDSFSTELQNSKLPWGRHWDGTTTWGQWANISWNRMEA